MKVPHIAVVLRPYKDKQNQQAISLRITFDRKPIYKMIGRKTTEQNFNQKAEAFRYVLPGDTKHLEKNSVIKKEYEKLESIFYAMQIGDIEFTFDNVKDVVDDKSTITRLFYPIASQYIEQTIENKGTQRRWEYCQELVHSYEPKLKIESIDKKWLHNFLQYLKLKYEEPNSRLAPLKFIRAVLNFAIDKMGMEIKYPFGQGQFKLPSEKKTIRNYLTTAQLNELEQLVPTIEDLKCRENGYWLIFQCYTGLRYSDIENWSNDKIRENRLYFADVKTDTPHFIPMDPQLEIITNRIKNLAPPKYEAYKHNLKAIGISLKLKFTLTSHVARHTFAVHYLQSGGSIFYLQKLLGHSQLETTLVYSHITHEGIEADMRRVRANK